MHLRHHRATHFHRIVLLGHRAIIAQVIGAVVDPANERPLAIHHDDLAVQAPEEVGPHAGHPRLRVESVKTHTRFGHGRNEGIRQVGCAVPIHRQFHPYAAARRIDQNTLQLLADLIVEDDERFQQDFFARLGHGLEYTRVIAFSIDQQLDAVALHPRFVHRFISAANGAWSDKCDQG
ncbi:hypothetical protein D3C81_1517440 [compost metagenome]